MRCLKCQSVEDKVIDSRMSKDGDLIRRRRECLRCGHRFTTYEQLEQTELRVIKRDGTRESFSRAKLLSGLVKACEKRPVSIDSLEAATDSVIQELAASGLKEIPTRIIGPSRHARIAGDRSRGLRPLRQRLPGSSKPSENSSMRFNPSNATRAPTGINRNSSHRSAASRRSRLSFTPHSPYYPNTPTKLISLAEQLPVLRMPRGEIVRY